MFELIPLGDRGWLARFEDEATAALWHGVAKAGLTGRAGISDVVLAYRSVAVFADCAECDILSLEETLRGLPSELTVGKDEGALVEIPVLYDGADLDFVADSKSLSAEEVIRLHTDCVYNVFAIGFLPGFPYAGYLPEQLSGVPRKTSPRKSVPTGSVAIAGRQTGVYPCASPGGWNLVGRTPCVIASLDEEFFPIRAGDCVRFVRIDDAEYSRLAGERLSVSRSGTLPLKT